MKRKYQYFVEEIVILIEVIIIIVVGYIAYTDAVNYHSDEKKEWVVENSPYGEYRIVIYHDTTKLPFAKQQLLICVNNPSFDLAKQDDNSIIGEYKSYMSVEINNRNQPITKENYKLDWLEDGAILTLNGRGQKPISYIIKWDNVFWGEMNQ